MMAAQVNMQIDCTGVTLASYTPRNLFPGRPFRHIAQLKGRTYLEEAVEPRKVGRPAVRAETAPSDAAALNEPAAEEAAAVRLESAPWDTITLAAAEAAAERVMHEMRRERSQDLAEAAKAELMLLLHQLKRKQRDFGILSAGEVGAERMMLEQHSSAR